MAISQKLLNPGEVVVVSTRTHPKALLRPLLVLVVLLAAGTALQWWLGTDGTRGTVVLVAWGLLAVAAVVWVVWPFVVWLVATYTITDRRLITRQGVLTRTGHDIPLSRISDVAYEMHLTDRVLGCGTLIISDASTHGRVSLPDIPRVEQTQRRLNELLNAVHGGGGSGPGAPVRRDDGA